MATAPRKNRRTFVKRKTPLPKMDRKTLSAAIESYRSGGGKIQKLPPSPTKQNGMVNCHWGSMYESIFGQ